LQEKHPFSPLGHKNTSSGGISFAISLSLLIL
jgi:hypothetical protein